MHSSKLSAREIERILKGGPIVRGAPVPKRPGVTEGVITCPHCGEPIPIRVAVGKIDLMVQFPRHKAKMG